MEKLLEVYNRYEGEMIQTNRIESEKQEKLNRVDNHLRNVSKDLDHAAVDRYDVSMMALGVFSLNTVIV